MSALALSVLLSLVSAVAYAGGAIVQEQVAASASGEQYAPLRRPVWWAAVALNCLGALLHVVALAYGPLSLVQPLGALTIVFALPMAALFAGRRAGTAAWRGAVLATVGLAGLLTLVGASQARSLDGTQRVSLALVTGGVVVALMTAGRVANRHPAVRSVLLATASGAAFGMSSVFTKAVAVDWTDGVTAADLPSLAVIGVLATTGMLLSQASYRGGGLAAPLATLTVVNPVAAAAVGITMFGETFRHGITGTVLALGCGVVAAGGLIMLTSERIERTAPVVPPGSVPAQETPSQDTPSRRAPSRDTLSLEAPSREALSREAAPVGMRSAATLPGRGLPQDVRPPQEPRLAGVPRERLRPGGTPASGTPAEKPAAAGIPGSSGPAPADVLPPVPAPTAPQGAAPGTGRDETPADQGAFHGTPFWGVPVFGGAYVPVLVLDRHRAHAGS